MLKFLTPTWTRDNTCIDWLSIVCLVCLASLGWPTQTLASWQQPAQISNPDDRMVPDESSVLAKEIPALKLRRVYVPETELAEWMKNRPEFWPLSTTRLRQILEAIPNDSVADDPVPLSHTLQIDEFGTLQGLSLFRFTDTANLGMEGPLFQNVPRLESSLMPTDPGRNQNRWMSLQFWKLPGSFFRWTPQASVSSLNPTWETIQYDGVAITPAVNEEGVFGVWRAALGEYLAIRYELDLAVSDGGTLRQFLHLPHAPETVTTVQMPASIDLLSDFDSQQQVVIHLPAPLESKPVSRMVQVLSTEQNIALRFRKKNRPFTFFPPNPAPEKNETSVLATNLLRHDESISMAITEQGIQYSNQFQVQLPDAKPAVIASMIPEPLQIDQCQVDGKDVPYQMVRQPDGTKQLQIDAQSFPPNFDWTINGTLARNSTPIFWVPRCRLIGSQWLSGQLQVSLREPVSLVDYQLIDCRVESSRWFGDERSIQIAFASPESMAKLILRQLNENTIMRSLSLISIDRDDIQVEQRLSLNLRQRPTNVIDFAVGSEWIVQQIGQVQAVPRLELSPGQNASANFEVEEEFTPLRWYIQNDASPRSISVELPEAVLGKNILLRVRAYRPSQLGRLDLGQGLVCYMPNETEFTQLVSLRAQAPLAAAVSTSSQAEPITIEAARLRLPDYDFRPVNEPLFLVPSGNALALEIEDRQRTIFSATAYVENRLVSAQVLQQTHRLLVNPESSTVSSFTIEGVVGPSALLTWQVLDEKGREIRHLVREVTQPVPESELALNGETPLRRWNLSLNSPITQPFSVLVGFEATIPPQGSLPRFFLPEASRFSGWIETTISGKNALVLSGESPSQSTDLSTPENEMRLLRENQKWARWWTSTRALSSTGNSESGTPLLPFSLVPDAAAENNFAANPLASNAGTAMTSLRRYRSLGASIGYTVEPEQALCQTSACLKWHQVLYLGEHHAQSFCQGNFSTVAYQPLRLTLPPAANSIGLRVDGLLHEFTTTDTVDGRLLEVPLHKIGAHTLELEFLLPLDRWGVGSTLHNSEVRFDCLPVIQNFTYMLPPQSDWLDTSHSLAASTEDQNGIWHSASRMWVSPLLWPGGLLGSSQSQARHSPHPLAELTWIHVPRFWAWHWFVFGLSFAFTMLLYWFARPRTTSIVGESFLPHRQRTAIPRGWFPTLLWAAAVLLAGVALTWVAWQLWPTISSGLLAFAHSLLATLLLGSLLAWALSRILFHSLSPVVKRLVLTDPWQSLRRRRWAILSLRFWCILFSLGLSDLAWSQDRQIPLSPSASETSQSDRESIDELVIPLDENQQLSASAVYVRPETYRWLTQLGTLKTNGNGLEFYGAKYTLVFDSQLQTFSRLSCQLQGKVKATQVYDLDIAPIRAGQLRQIRVDGVPRLFNPGQQTLRLNLEANQNLILDLDYDVQSVKDALVIRCMPVLSSTLEIQGLPSGWFAEVRDRMQPENRFRSSSQRTFRLDRMSSVLLQVADSIEKLLPPTIETWVRCDADNLACQSLLHLGANRELSDRWEIEVDSRLSLRSSVTPGDWAISLIQDKGATKCYRIDLETSFAAERPIVLNWNFAANSLGDFVPPRVALRWPKIESVERLVMSLDRKLFYQPLVGGNPDETESGYRRAANLELLGIPGGTAGRTRPFESADYVYLWKDSAAAQGNPAMTCSAVLAALSLQPLEASGAVTQDLYASEQGISSKILAEINVTQGELSQLRIALPPGFHLKDVTVLQDARNQMAWMAEQESDTNKEVICFLRSPLSGNFTLEANGEFQGGTKEGSFGLPLIDLPWIAQCKTQVNIFTKNDDELQGPFDTRAEAMAANPSGDTVGPSGQMNRTVDDNPWQVIAEISAETSSDFRLSKRLEHTKDQTQPIPKLWISLTPQENRFQGLTYFSIDSAASSGIKMVVLASDPLKPFQSIQVRGGTSSVVPKLVSARLLDRSNQNPPSQWSSLDAERLAVVNVGSNVNPIWQWSWPNPVAGAVFELHLDTESGQGPLKLPQLVSSADGYRYFLLEDPTLRSRFALAGTPVSIAQTLKQFTPGDWSDENHLPDWIDLNLECLDLKTIGADLTLGLAGPNITQRAAEVVLNQFWPSQLATLQSEDVSEDELEAPSEKASVRPTVLVEGLQQWVVLNHSQEKIKVTWPKYVTVRQVWVDGQVAWFRKDPEHRSSGTLWLNSLQKTSIVSFRLGVSVDLDETHSSDRLHLVTPLASPDLDYFYGLPSRAVVAVPESLTGSNTSLETQSDREAESANQSSVDSGSNLPTDIPSVYQRALNLWAANCLDDHKVFGIQPSVNDRIPSGADWQADQPWPLLFVPRSFRNNIEANLAEKNDDNSIPRRDFPIDPSLRQWLEFCQSGVQHQGKLSKQGLISGLDFSLRNRIEKTKSAWWERATNQIHRAIPLALLGTVLLLALWFGARTASPFAQVLVTTLMTGLGLFTLITQANITLSCLLFLLAFGNAIADSGRTNQEG